MQKKLHQLIEDYKILSEKMTDLNIINNVAEYTRLAKEHRKLAPVINKSEEYLKLVKESDDNKELLLSEDIELKELAKEDGPYSTYEGSPLAQGKFQFDLWGVKPSNMWDWDGLKDKIKKNGVRNSLTTACMPTASTGIILGNTETFQIQTSNIYKRQTLSGEFLLVNRYLVEELTKRNLWNKEMRDNIILENGSVQNIPDFCLR